MKRTEKDSAVSPVVGVMLMLVVTIIIAAVIAVFASGVTSTTEPSPNVVLKADVDHAWNVSDYGTTGNGTVYLTSLNGNTLDLSKVTVKVTNATGSIATFVDPSHALFGGQPKLDAGESINVGYACAPYQTIESAGAIVAAGETVRVMVQYDDSYVLFDKEVVAV